ncbi:hypothetical protein BaRGS_00024879 [Batillaria attramentaria]|uniref:Uncharacterized protein n=1 Tax=Batillaria attramentaria TaxID=370345 RepID=A0ABD0K9W0_9CAEN
MRTLLHVTPLPPTTTRGDWLPWQTQWPALIPARRSTGACFVKERRSVCLARGLTCCAVTLGVFRARTFIVSGMEGPDT